MWDQSAQPVAQFADVRELQESLDAQGVGTETRADPDGTGPAHIVLFDPDGNVIMLDQHVQIGRFTTASSKLSSGPERG